MNFKYCIGSRSFGDDKYNIFLSIGDAFGRSPIVYAEEILDHYPDHTIYDETQYLGASLNWAYRYHPAYITNSLRTTLSNAYKRYIAAPSNDKIIKAFLSNPLIKVSTVLTYDEERTILIVGDNCNPEWPFSSKPFVEYRAFSVFRGTLNDCVALSNSHDKVVQYCTEGCDAIFANSDTFNARKGGE